MKSMAAVAASVEETPAPAAAPGLLPETRSRRAGRAAGHAAAAAGRSRSVDLPLHHSAQLESATGAAGFYARLVSVSLRLAEPAEDDHQPRDRRGREVSADDPRLPVRARALPDGAVLRVSRGRADQRRLQVLHQHLQGTARRADAATASAIELYLRLLRFPLTYFQTRSSAQIIPMVTAESESLGGFIGDALAHAGLSGRHAADHRRVHVRAGPGAGAAAISLYPMQALRDPEAAAQGQRTRQAAGAHRPHRRRPHPARSAAGMVEIHANDTVTAAPDRFRPPLGAIYDIRFEIYQPQVLRQIPQQFHQPADAVLLLLDRRLSGDPRRPVVRRAGGGAGGLQGHVLAVEGAARLLPADSRTRGSSTSRSSSSSSRPGLARRPPAARGAGEHPARCTASCSSATCRWPRTTASASLDAVSFNLRLDEHIAVIGPERQRQERARPAAGAAGAADRRAHHDRRPRSRRRCRSRWSAAASAMSAPRPICSPAACATICCSACGTGRCGRPITTTSAMRRRRARSSTRRAAPATCDLDLHADWVDYAAGRRRRRRRNCRARIAEILVLARSRGGRLQFRPALADRPGRRSRSPPDALLEARQALARAAGRCRASRSWSRPSTPSATTPTPRVAENLLFGTPIGPAFDFEALADNAYVLSVLDKIGLTEELIEIGREVAAMMTEMFADLPPDHEFFEQFSFISAERPAGLRRHPQRDGRRRRQGAASASSGRSCCRCRSS